MSEIVEVLNEIVERHDCSHPAIVSKASAEITRLTEEVERLKKEIIGRQAHDRMQVREIKHLTAEVAEYEATFDAAWEADMRGVQMWREAHPGNDMVLPDRANFTSWILAEIVIQRAENEKLRVALRECETELNAYYRMKYPGDHPYSQQELAQAMASNPATVSLSGDKP
jgi:hypothetical protein